MIYPKLMRYSKLTDQAAAVAVALGELDVRPDDRVLIMLPDGPDFAESFTGVMQQGAVPLPVNPLLSPPDVVSAAAAARAQLVLAPVDRLRELAELDAEPPALIDGPHGLWAAALRLHEHAFISTAQR
jgi:benzoate-CoA ligase